MRLITGVYSLVPGGRLSVVDKYFTANIVMATDQHIHLGISIEDLQRH